MNPLELCLVTAGIQPEGGGTARVARLLFRALRDGPHQTHLRFLILRGAPPGDWPADSFQTFDGSRLRLTAAVWQATLQPGVRVLYDHIGPARIHGLTPWLCPFAIFCHGIEVWRPLPRTAARALEQATLLLANSDHTRQRAARYHPAAARARPVPLGLPDQPVEDAPDATLLRQVGEGFFLMVGRMAQAEGYKGHDQVLDALADPLLDAHQLVVVGGGDDRPRLEQRAIELGLGQQVRFTGFVSEATLRALYDRAVALVLPSRDEGFGLVYLEAMRAGRPCIGVEGGAAQEIIQPGRTGLLVPYGQVRPLRAAMHRLASDTALAERLGEAGRSRYQRSFTEASFRQRLWAALTPILETG